MGRVVRVNRSPVPAPAPAPASCSCSCSCLLLLLLPPAPLPPAPASCLLLSAYCFLSTGPPAFCHATKPPSSAAVLVIPLLRSFTAAPADVCSAGQEQ